MQPRGASKPDPIRDSYRVRSSLDGLGIAEVGAICLVLWRAPVTTQRFQRQRAAVEDLAVRYPGDAGLICVVEAHSPAPEDKYRRASVDMISQLGDRLRCVACVIEGAGFRAAATRSVLSGMALLLSNKCAQVRFMSTVLDAADWVTERSSRASVVHVVSAHEALRRELAAR